MRGHNLRTYFFHATMVVLLAIGVTCCANMGTPDGGWYDERPPYVVGAAPNDRATDVKEQKMSIFFNEFIKLDNATENVVVSPPQLEQPEITATGRRINIKLADTLLPNTTYTVDFSDAILDNNESNPMGNYTYTFSTGEQIDTMECSGVVLTAEALEPVKGILVGLYRADQDSLLRHRKDSLPAFIRVARTNSEGRFVIRGIQPGEYIATALQDMDGDYRFSQRGETMAFSYTPFTTDVYADVRQDTIWADSLHIRDIKRVRYSHFTPDNLVLLTFDHEQTDRYYLKAERTDAEKFTLFFTAPVLTDSMVLAQKPAEMDDVRMPLLRGLNFDATDAFVTEASQKCDTVTYWLRDTALVNNDTLMVEMTTFITDTMGVMQLQTDTLEILAKTSYAKRMKEQQKAVEEWEKNLEKRRKRLDEGEVLTDTIMPPTFLEPKIKLQQSMTPDGAVYITFPTPMKTIQRDSVHLYVEQDSLWYRAPFVFQPRQEQSVTSSDSLVREWELFSEWRQGAQYSLEIDTLAFEDIYGHHSKPYTGAFVVLDNDEFSTLFVEVTNAPEGTIIMQLLDGNEKLVREVKVVDGTAEFYYLKADKFYLRAFVDSNDNGEWDTGDFYKDRQPEPVYYFHDVIETRAKWDITKTWNMTAYTRDKQKPSAITKQKAEKKKTVQNRNEKRAREKGIPLPEELQN